VVPSCGWSGDRRASVIIASRDRTTRLADVIDLDDELDDSVDAGELAGIPRQ
jgi:hypothetical protein